MTMKTIPLSEAKDKLSALVEEADTTHEIVQITKHGRPAAVLMSADALESLQRDACSGYSSPASARTSPDGRGRVRSRVKLSAPRNFESRYGLPPR